MKMTAHPNGMSWTLCYQCVCLFLCVCVFVSSARGQTLSETSWFSGHCWSVGRCVRRISWALKCFRSNHPSLFLSVLYLFSFAFCLHFPLAMDFFLLVYRSLFVYHCVRFYTCIVCVSVTSDIRLIEDAEQWVFLRSRKFIQHPFNCL